MSARNPPVVNPTHHVANDEFVSALNAELDEMTRASGSNSRLGKLIPKPKQPLLTRWWIPYACGAAIVVIWIPDKYKVRALYAIDDAHDTVKLAVHKWYWRMTMPTEQYSILMEQLAANVPKSERVKSSDCPL